MLITKIANTKEELEGIGKLRYKRICEELRYKDPSLFPNQKEFDKFDKFSIHFVVKLRDSIIATDRLVKDSEYGFPMEAKFKLPPSLNRKKIVEISRLVIEERFSHNPYVLLKLFGENYRYSKKQGFTHWCAAVDEQLLEGLLKLGFCFMVIGEKSYFNDPEWDIGSYIVPVIPVILNLQEVEIYLQGTNPKLYEKITGLKSRPLIPLEKEKVKAIERRIKSYL